MVTRRSGRLITPFVCQSCRLRLLAIPRRQFTTTKALQADEEQKPQDNALSGLQNISRQMGNSSSRPNRFNNASRSSNAPDLMSALDGPFDQDSFLSNEFHQNADGAYVEQHHKLHVYAHKHNTHITFVQPPRTAAETPSLRMSASKTSATDQKKTVDTLLSLSTGNIGFTKAGRGSYDAAFQLAAFALRQIQEKGMLGDVKTLDVILRGFGAGREAVTKALLGTEGRLIRNRISSVVDATRLKQGGPRSKKPRRLG